MFAFSDQGAWHMFGLSEAAVGGFSGPLLLTARGRWIGSSLVTVAVELTGEAEPIDWSRPADGSLPVSYPGRLHDRLIGPGGLEVELDLVGPGVEECGSLLDSRWFRALGAGEQGEDHQEQTHARGSG